MSLLKNLSKQNSGTIYTFFKGVQQARGIFSEQKYDKNQTKTAISLLKSFAVTDRFSGSKCRVI
jgi:hypothetical protein